MDKAGISDGVIGFVGEMAVEANANAARLGVLVACQKNGYVRQS